MNALKLVVLLGALYLLREKEDKRPYLLIRLGSKDILADSMPWIPSKQDLERTQEHFQKVMESKYRVMVFHQGIDMTILQKDQALNLIETEITSLEQLKKEIGEV